ncbi:Nucleotide excision repair factor NEF2, RAD4/CUT5 component [Plasmopara halstedii]|uniref:Nucleotide excision repair factor NEF2, RAD4/CUT5 component n=1 Tax=Plasmopara halstedii TaxID=4781 RepID=A0A0P1B756_PLAHL|nr:Nucleotide excision repair factor NEF2, RAD4/CUT5 component [Plasmopara halstedii]CEG50132.1 Nucleotide excision repair factor NEF2, RAD4/CUT5 component [Plasmopara halstedii]|eukprot:XP_024586501.1 Nucleotide excision repair factor NEF2, RAD4/CUT5 component [Plasmopara halstedii]
MGEQDKLFTGLCISSTGLELDVKQQVRKIIVSCGGRFDDDLDPKTTTHLIAKAVGSLKYRVAVSNSLRIASPRWVFESFRAQKLLNVQSFKLQLLEGLRVCTTGLTVEEKESVSRLVTTNGEGAKYNAAVATNIPIVHLETKDSKLLPTNIASTQLKETQINEDWMDLFDGCVVYFLGFSSRFHTLLQRLIRTVSASLSDKNTLVALQERVIAANVGNAVHFVSANWVIDSVKCLDLQPEELYPIEFDVNVPKTSPDATSHSLNPRENSVVIERNFADCNEETNRKFNASSENASCNVDEADAMENSKKNKKSRGIFSGYSFLLLCRDPEDKYLIEPMVMKIRDSGDAEAFALSALDFVRLDPEHFSFITHAVICTGAIMNEPEALEMQERIHQIQRQEHFNQADNKADDNRKTPRRRMLQFVSDLWLTCSLAAKTKLSFSSHELFEVSANRPRALFTCPVPIPGFHDVIASTSVYLDVEQLVVIQLLEIAGAQVTRKLSTRNTHLICRKAIGMKFTKASEWGIHVVKARWIVDSLLQGKRLNENNPNYQVVEEEEDHLFSHAANKDNELSQSSPCL